MKFQTVEYNIVWVCSFSDGEDGQREKKYYFSSESEARKYAETKSGPWGNLGRVYDLNFRTKDLPLCFETARDCGLENMKTSDFLKHFKV